MINQTLRKSNIFLGLATLTFCVVHAQPTRFNDSQIQSILNQAETELIRSIPRETSLRHSRKNRSIVNFSAAHKRAVRAVREDLRKNPLLKDPIFIRNLVGAEKVGILAGTKLTSDAVQVIDNPNEDPNPGLMTPRDELGRPIDVRRIPTPEPQSCTIAIYSPNGICIGSGVRISAGSILTAAHVARLFSHGEVRGYIRSGKLVSSDSEGYPILADPQFLTETPYATGCGGSNTPDDVALISVNIPDNSGIGIANLWKGGRVDPIVMGYVTLIGYGLTSTEYSQILAITEPNDRIDLKRKFFREPRARQVGVMPLPSQEGRKCVENEFIFGTLTSSGLGSSSCEADSGGPLFVVDSAGKFWLVGIVSRGSGAHREISGQMTDIQCGYRSVAVELSAYSGWFTGNGIR